MNTKNIMLGIVTAISLGFAGQAGAEPYKELWQVRGNGAYATAYSDDGCRLMALDISANETATHTMGAPVSGAVVWANFWLFDWCNAREAYGGAYIPDSGFNGSLKGASVSVSFNVEMYGVVQTPEGYWDYVYLGSEPLAASITWTGTGDSQWGMESWTGRWNRSLSRYRWMGTSRDADVNISATLGGSPLTFDFRLGSVGSYQSGVTEVYHY